MDTIYRLIGWLVSHQNAVEVQISHIGNGALLRPAPDTVLNSHMASEDVISVLIVVPMISNIRFVSIAPEHGIGSHYRTKDMFVTLYRALRAYYSIIVCFYLLECSGHDLESKSKEMKVGSENDDESDGAGNLACGFGRSLEPLNL